MCAQSICIVVWWDEAFPGEGVLACSSPGRKRSITAREEPSHDELWENKGKPRTAKLNASKGGLSKDRVSTKTSA